MHRLTSERLDAEAVSRLVEGPDAGAVVVFVGTVRGTSHGRRVVRLEYEAYEPMALATFERLAGEGRRFGNARVAIHHRVGSCEVGEPTVVVAAAAPHRADAFDACRFAIDTLKAEAAIWKREVYEDGAEWVGCGS